MRRMLVLITGTAVVLWVAWTLASVVRIGGPVVTDLESTRRIMSVRNDGDVTSAVGLTYHGVRGAVLVVVEIVLVLIALARALFGRGPSRLLGVAILIGWCGLWFGNAMWLQSLGWNRGGDVVVAGAGLAVTVVWSLLLLLLAGGRDRDENGDDALAVEP